MDQVVEQATSSGVDAIQLHGTEDVDFVQALRSRLPGTWVLKVVHIPASTEDASGTESLDGLQSKLASYGAQCDALLLDTSVKGGPSGGTGAGRRTAAGH